MFKKVTIASFMLIFAASNLHAMDTAGDKAPTTQSSSKKASWFSSERLLRNGAYLIPFLIPTPIPSPELKIFYDAQKAYAAYKFVKELLPKKETTVNPTITNAGRKA